MLKKKEKAINKMKKLQKLDRFGSFVASAIGKKQDLKRLFRRGTIISINFVMANLVLISEGLNEKNEEFNGFPLAVGLFNIIFKSFDLLEEKKKNP